MLKSVSVIARRLLIATLAITLSLAGPASTMAAEDPVIRIAYQPSVAGAAVTVAESEGFFAAEGLNVESKVLASGPLVNEALASGWAAFGIMGDSPSVIAVSSGLPLVIVATVGGGAQRERVMIPKGSTIKSVRELVGKRLGITFGSSAQAAWYRLAEKERIPVEQVKLINMQPSEMVEALATGQIDAALAWEPTPTIMEAKGIGKELASLSIIGNTFPFQLLANAKLVSSRPDLIEKMLRAIDKAAAFVRKNPAKAAQTVAKITGLEPDLALKSMSYHFFEVGLPPATYSSLKTTAEFLLEYKSIRKMPDWYLVIDRRFVDKLAGK